MDKSDHLSDAFVGLLAGAFAGAITGGALVWVITAGFQWMTRHDWVEYWGDVIAIVYGMPAGAVLGAIVGAILGYRGVTFRK